MEVLALKNTSNRSFYSILVFVVIVVLLVVLFTLPQLVSSRSKFKANEVITSWRLPSDKYGGTHLYSQSLSSMNVSYMLALRYPEQLTMSTAHYIQLLNLIGGWNFTGVESFFCESTMYALHQPNKVNIKFSHLINLSNLVEELGDCLEKSHFYSSRPVVHSLNDFLLHSYRNLLVVYFIKHKYVLPKKIHNQMDSSVKFDKEPIVDCTATAAKTGLAESVAAKLNKELDTAMNEDLNANQLATEFYVEQVFCIHKTMDVSLLQIMDYIYKNIKHREGLISSTLQRHLASVVFVTWQGHYTRKLPDRSTTMDRCWSKIFRSDLVKRTTKQFVKSLGLSVNPYLSIHIRFEKLFEHKQNNTELFYECSMKKLNVLIDQMKQRCNLSRNSSVLLMHDYGHYSSDTCHFEGKWKPVTTCKDKAEKLLSIPDLKPAGFDPKKFGLPLSSGLVSLVEADSLLYGSALIVVAGGSFQDSIAKKFKNTHSRECTTSLNLKDVLKYDHTGTASCVT